MGLAVPMKQSYHENESNLICFYKESGDSRGGQPEALRSREGEGEEQALLRKRGLWEKVGGVHGHTRNLGGN